MRCVFLCEINTFKKIRKLSISTMNYFKVKNNNNQELTNQAKSLKDENIFKSNKSISNLLIMRINFWIYYIILKKI